MFPKRLTLPAGKRKNPATVATGGVQSLAVVALDKEPSNSDRTPAPVASKAPKYIDNRRPYTVTTLEMLAERWPTVFPHHEARRRPLKIDIFDDIIRELGDTIHQHELRIALRVYTTNLVYLSRLTAGAPRYGLDGEVAGEVSLQHAANAAVKLAAKPDKIARSKALRALRNNLAKTKEPEFKKRLARALAELERGGQS
jgi:hypothetical protein